MLHIIVLFPLLKLQKGKSSTHPTFNYLSNACTVIIKILPASSQEKSNKKRESNFLERVRLYMQWRVSKASSTKDHPRLLLLLACLLFSSPTATFFRIHISNKECKRAAMTGRLFTRLGQQQHTCGEWSVVTEGARHVCWFQERGLHTRLSCNRRWPSVERNMGGEEVLWYLSNEMIDSTTNNIFNI